MDGNQAEQSKGHLCVDSNQPARGCPAEPKVEPEARSWECRVNASGRRKEKSYCLFHRTMGEADFCGFSHISRYGLLLWVALNPLAGSMPRRFPRVRAITFLPCNHHIYRIGFGQHWTSSCVADCSALIRPSMWFLFVGSGVCPHVFSVTSGLLQIPPRNGYPCLQLTLSAAERVADFHHQVIAHTGRTTKRALGLTQGSLQA